MTLVPLKSLFHIKYGNGLSLNNLVQCDKLTDDCVNFVSRTSKNNGVSAIVKAFNEYIPFEAGLITVAVSGSVMESFVQSEPFYTAYHVVVLTPIKEMLLAEKLFYCMCIRKNKYRFCYGRQANRTIKDIGVPSESPEWVKQSKTSERYENLLLQTQLSGQKLKEEICLEIKTWKAFKYQELFEIKKGKRVTNSQIESGNVPFIRPLNHNNGYSDWISLPPNHEGNTITVNYNSAGGVGEAYYQPVPYFAMDDVNVLYPKFDLTPEIAMFLIALIRKEKYRFNYGRKWHLKRMQESIIKLPTDKSGKPDWNFMQKYIENLSCQFEIGQGFSCLELLSVVS